MCSEASPGKSQGSKAYNVIYEPSSLSFQILANPSYARAVDPLSPAMQASTIAGAQCSWQLTISRNGLLSGALMLHRFRESNLSFCCTLGLNHLPVSVAVMFATVLQVVAGLRRSWSSLQGTGHETGQAMQGQRVFLSAASKRESAIVANWEVRFDFC